MCFHVEVNTRACDGRRGEACARSDVPGNQAKGCRCFEKPLMAKKRVRVYGSGLGSMVGGIATEPGVMGRPEGGECLLDSIDLDD